MNIYVKTVCPEVLPTVRDGEYEVPERATAESVVERCLELCGREGVPGDYKSRLLYLRNGNRADATTVLQEGDKLYLLRPLYGG